MINRSLAFVAALGLGVASSPATAQEARKLDFGLQARAVHDTNLARTDATQAAVRGIVPEDTIFTPAVTFDLVLPVSRQSFFLNGRAGYDFHRENDQLNSESLDLKSGLRTRLGPCQPSLLGSYARRQSDLQDIGLVNPENVLESTHAGIDVACSRDVGLGGALSIGRDWIRNSNPTQFQADYNASSVIGSIGYRRPTFGSLLAVAQYQKVEFENRAAGGGQGGYEMLGVGLIFERRLSSRLQGKLSVFQTKVDTSASPVVGGVRDFSGLTYGVDATFRPTTRLTTQFQYERAVTPSKYVGKLYDVGELARLRADYELSSRFAVGLGAERRDVTSQGVATAIQPGILLTDSRTNVIFGSLTFKQSERISIQMDVQNEERSANNPVFDYTSTRVGLTTNLAF